MPYHETNSLPCNSSFPRWAIHPYAIPRNQQFAMQLIEFQGEKGNMPTIHTHHSTETNFLPRNSSEFKGSRARSQVHPYAIPRKQHYSMQLIKLQREKGNMPSVHRPFTSMETSLCRLTGNQATFPIHPCPKTQNNLLTMQLNEISKGARQHPNNKAAKPRDIETLIHTTTIPRHANASILASMNRPLKSHGPTKFETAHPSQSQAINRPAARPPSRPSSRQQGSQAAAHISQPHNNATSMPIKASPRQQISQIKIHKAE